MAFEVLEGGSRGPIKAGTFKIYNIYYYFLNIYFLICTREHVGSWFSSQGLDSNPLHWKAQSLNHWTSREVPRLAHF